MSRSGFVIAVSLGSLMLVMLVLLATPVGGDLGGVEEASEPAAQGAGAGNAHALPPPEGARDDPPPAGVVWDFRPQTVDEMAQRAEAIVVGRVVGVRPGPFIQPRGTQDSTGEGALPTQRISVHVSDSLDEGLKIDAGSTVTLFRTGGTRETGVSLELEGDPEYRPGDRYVLFLRERDAGDGTLLPVAPDGRLSLDSDGQMMPLIEGPVGESLDGRTVRELEASING